MCSDCKEKPVCAKRRDITGQATNFTFPQMLTSLAVLRETEISKKKKMCFTAQVSQPSPHSSVILKDTTIKNNPMSVVAARAKNYI